MAIAILLGVLVLLGAGLVIALKMAANARRELDDLEGEFAEARGSLALDSDSDPEPWSSVDLEVLRDDVIVVESDDPFDTLTEMISSSVWANADEHAQEHGEHDGADSTAADRAAAVWDESEESDELPHSGPTWLASHEWDDEPEHELDAWLASQDGNGSKTTTTDVAPVEDSSPVAWHAPTDAPIIILVVGVGFLGAGRVAGVTNATRLRRAWGEFEDSLSQARVITLDPEGRQTAESEFDRAAPLDGIVVEDDHETFPPPESDDAIVWPPPRRNGWRPRPNGELKPIEWRCPDGVTVGR